MPPQEMPSIGDHGSPQGGPPGQPGPEQNMPPRDGRPESRGPRLFIGGIALPIEISQILFIGLYITLAKMIANRKSS